MEKDSWKRTAGSGQNKLGTKNEALGTKERDRRSEGRF
jgi:hypothetical protein